MNSNLCINCKKNANHQFCGKTCAQDYQTRHLISNQPSAPNKNSILDPNLCMNCKSRPKQIPYQFCCQTCFNTYKMKQTGQFTTPSWEPSPTRNEPVTSFSYGNGGNSFPTVNNNSSFPCTVCQMKPRVLPNELKKIKTKRMNETELDTELNKFRAINKLNVEIWERLSSFKKDKALRYGIIKELIFRDCTLLLETEEKVVPIPSFSRLFELSDSEL